MSCVYRCAPVDCCDLIGRRRSRLSSSLDALNDVSTNITINPMADIQELAELNMTPATEAPGVAVTAPPRATAADASSLPSPPLVLPSRDELEHRLKAPHQRRFRRCVVVMTRPRSLSHRIFWHRH